MSTYAHIGRKVPGGTHAQRGQRIPVRVMPGMCHLFHEGGTALAHLLGVAEHAENNLKTIGTKLS